MKKGFSSLAYIVHYERHSKGLLNVIIYGMYCLPDHDNNNDNVCTVSGHPIRTSQHWDLGPPNQNVPIVAYTDRELQH